MTLNLKSYWMSSSSSFVYLGLICIKSRQGWNKVCVSDLKVVYMLYISVLHCSIFDLNRSNLLSIYLYSLVDPYLAFALILAFALGLANGYLGIDTVVKYNSALVNAISMHSYITPYPPIRTYVTQL